MSELSINHPTFGHDSKDTAIPSRFVAVGTISLDSYTSRDGAVPKIKDVIGILVLRDASGQPTSTPVAEGKTLSIRYYPACDTAPHGYFKWAIFFKTDVAQPIPVQLLVAVEPKANPALQGTANLWIRQYGFHAIPEFDVPSGSSHQLTTDEQTYFFVCGPSDYPLTELKFNGNDSDYAEWSVGDEYFWGEFYNLGATPGAVLAANADGPNSITITV